MRFSKYKEGIEFTKQNAVKARGCTLSRKKVFLKWLPGFLFKHLFKA